MIALIVARSKNNVIGKNGKIPWNIPGEREQFKKLTTGNVVVMGRRTYEEIGFPLPDRVNLVVSKTRKFQGEHLFTVSSLSEAIQKAGDRDIYIAGGYQLYLEGLPLADRLYITEVDVEIEGGDTFFPEFSQEAYEKEVGETLGEETGIRYTRVIWYRKDFLTESGICCTLKNVDNLNQ